MAPQMMPGMIDLSESPKKIGRAKREGTDVDIVGSWPGKRKRESGRTQNLDKDEMDVKVMC